MLPTVSVCMVVRDDLPFVKKAMARAAEYASQIVVIDNGSKDGSVEWLKDWVHPEVDFVFEQAPATIIPELGYSFLKNHAAQLATGDWIHSLDADECLPDAQVGMIKPFLKYCKKDIVSITTKTFKLVKHFHDEDWAQIASHAPSDDCGHRRIYRRGTGVEWKGYIHEELYQGETPGISICQLSQLVHWHFTEYRTWTNDNLKRARYSWMLLNAYRRPGLQAYTNRWWYTVYVPQHLKDIEHWAAIYEDALKQEEKDHGSRSG